MTDRASEEEENSPLPLPVYSLRPTNIYSLSAQINTRLAF